MDVLVRIKRLVLSGQYRFTEKARDEMDIDGLVPQDIVESILNAQSIKKTLRSTSQRRQGPERLHVIESFNYSGTLIYTKGKITNEQSVAVYYVLVSSKRATLGG
jgi:hypothetical protein